MGNKIPFDFASKNGMKKNTSIYNTDRNGIPTPNRWGYRYNINHPQIRPLYAAYHKHIGVPEQIHLTTPQRLQFEAMLDRIIEKKRSDSHV